MARIAARTWILSSLSAVLVSSSVGCAQDDENAGALGDVGRAGVDVNAAPDEDTPLDDEDLGAAGIESDEFVADEVSDDSSLASAAADDPWSDDDVLPLENDAVQYDAEDGTYADDLEDYASNAEMPFDPAAVDTLSHDALALGGRALRSVSADIRRPHWWSSDSPCPSNAQSCVCRGSPLNCQFPNAQVGRNRYLPPRAAQVLNRTTGKKARATYVDLLGRWGIDEGTELFDGSHILRGTIHANKKAPTVSPLVKAQTTACYSAQEKGSGYEIVKADVDYPCTKINFGLRKTMKHNGKDATFLYAFATGVKMAGSGSTYGMSGWILASSVKSANIAKMGTSTIRKSDAGFAKTQYVVKSGKDYGCEEGQAFDSTKCLPAFAQLKVRPKSSPNVSEKLRDYMLRDGSFLNLAFQTPLLGGAAADTVIVRKNALGFRRVKSTKANPTILRISLYHAKDATHAGVKPLGKRAFVFGSLAGSYGWVALSAIKPGTVEATVSADSCDGKAAGFYCTSDAAEFFYCNSKGFQTTGLCASGNKCVTGAGGKAVLSGEYPTCK